MGKIKKGFGSSKKGSPACPRCSANAAWKHDAKGRWWCKMCARAFTPGITCGNSGKCNIPCMTKKTHSHD